MKRKYVTGLYKLFALDLIIERFLLKIIKKINCKFKSKSTMIRHRFFLYKKKYKDRSFREYFE